MICSEFEFEFPKKFAVSVIEKGSICINGISLTAFDVKKKSFKAAIQGRFNLHSFIVVQALPSRISAPACINFPKGKRPKLQ